MPRSHPAAANLRWLAEYWPALTEYRIPGTQRPWRQPSDPDPSRRAERDALARLERLERDPDGLVGQYTPAHVDVLDAITDLVATAGMITDQLAVYTGTDRGRPADPGPSSDPRPHLEWAERAVTGILRDWGATPITGDDQRILDWVTAETRRLVDTVARVLSLAVDGQRLSTVCPWCHGITPDHPEGGQHTWRVRMLPGDEPAIVCESGTCEPPTKSVGTWWKGQPCWPVYEWEWLADRINHDTERTAS